MSTVPSKAAVFLGVHITADCVNVSAVTDSGEILGEMSAPFPIQSGPPSTKGISEQNPEIWWDSARSALGRLINQLRSKVASPSQLKAISVCGAPGTLVILDKNGNSLIPAILADDTRAVDQVTSLNYLGAEHCKKMGFQFRPDFALAKIAWIKENLPELYENAYFAHPTDFIIGKLKGQVDVTEFSIAARTGCDLIDECWPDWLDYDMHLGVRDRLPRLVQLGRQVGTVSSAAAGATGLPSGMPVVMGTTSDTASFLASGARRQGDFHTILHDGMTISGISSTLMNSSGGLIRSFKLPNRGWFYTTDSRTGTGWIKRWFAEQEFAYLEPQAWDLLPSAYLAYPNARKGETFPFNTSSAEGFISPATDNHLVQFASCLQGTALFERLCYQKLDKLTGYSGSSGDIFSGGEWSAFDSWMQCRADITGRANRRSVGRAEAVFGAAMIGALGVHFKSLEETATAMVRTEQVFYPDPTRVNAYSERFFDFVTLLEEQGYIADKGKEKSS